MRIQVSGTNMEVGQSLTNHVEESLTKEVKKYFEEAIDAHVAFSKDGPKLIKTVITVDDGIKNRKVTVKSDAKAEDAYGSFNEALEKAAKQLRRYKRRLKNFRKHIPGLKSAEPATYAIDATKYIIPVSNDESDENEDLAKEESPHIITEKTTDIETLSVNEATMKMDLANLPALVFVNNKTGNINVIYHRKDGNISWIDTKTKK